MRNLRAVDISQYARALLLLVRNPALLLAPVLGTVIGLFLGMLYGGGGIDPASAMISGGIVQLIVFLLQSFGLGVALIIADAAWRGRRASFDDAWVEARRKAGDILLAALGFNFVIYVASYAGSLVSPMVGFLLAAAALYFLIYTIPAAAIGGIPGSAALQASVERVQGSYLATGLLIVVAILAYYVIGWYLPVAYVPLGGITGKIILAFCQALALSYIALILAKSYANVSFGRR